MINVDIFPNGL